MATTPYVDPASVLVPEAGLALSAAWCNTVRDNLETLARAPGCKVRRTANQAIATSSFTPVEFTASDLRDTDAFHSTSSNPSKVIVPAGLGGWYSVAAIATLASGTTGWTMISQLVINGSTTVRLDRRVSSTAANMTTNGADDVQLAAGDELELSVWHDAGSDRNLTSASLSMRLVALS